MQFSVYVLSSGSLLAKNKHLVHSEKLKEAEAKFILIVTWLLTEIFFNKNGNSIEIEGNGYRERIRWFLVRKIQNLKLKIYGFSVWYRLP